ncbi:GH25 family lysozyme [Lacticaseibacillus pabuli]|uniref:GH25 family lysozyme n=1 Tax=Lacticaseibacillus pabuli TaxID=3025672 RepID=A0ABY7WWN2_9LACO|nr:GH25 family lysozyme [Lacticaseibacillus sp. KACC 23028]WDF83469.1 GH25 family lysozyme [Lacticaseibacillus sp. KACC 23028]
MRRVRPIYSDTFKRRRRRGIIAALVVLIIAVIAGGGFWLTHRTSRPSAKRYPVMGVRLDQSDGFQDFAALHNDGVDFAYLKATEGASYFDDDFVSNYHRAGGSTVALGVYHFFSFASNPETQADYFIKQVADRSGQLPIAVMVSAYTTVPSKQKLNASLSTFLARVEGYYGRTCVIMASRSMLRRLRPAIGSRHVIVQGSSTTSNAQFWEYGSAIQVGDAKYRGMVYTGNKADFTRLVNVNQ